MSLSDSTRKEFYPEADQVLRRIEKLRDMGVEGFGCTGADYDALLAYIEDLEDAVALNADPEAQAALAEAKRTTAIPPDFTAWFRSFSEEAWEDVDCLEAFEAGYAAGRKAVGP